MTKILVTGATGWLGKRLVQALVDKNHTVFAFARNTPKISPFPTGVEFVAGDVLKLDHLYRVMEKVDLVIHLAADMDFFPPNPDAVYTTNVDGTRNVVSAAASRGVKKIVYVSSTEAMGAVTTPEPRTEDDTTTPQFDYGKSKQLAEESVRELAEKEGVDFTIVRPSGIFNDFENEFQLIWAANLGLFFFTPFNKRHGTATFLHVDDVVSGILLAAESKRASKQTYILAGDSMTYQDLVSVTNKQCGRIEPLFTLPFSLAKPAMAALAPFLRRPFKKRFLFEPKMLDQMDLYRSFDAKKAETELGWKIPKMKPTLEKHVQDLFKRRKLRRYPVSPLAALAAIIVLLILIWILLM